MNLVAQTGWIDLCLVAYADLTRLRFARGREKARLIRIIDHQC